MSSALTPAKTTQIDQGWEWKQRDTKVKSLLEDLDGWHKATSFPSEVHVELLKAGLIPDPYVGFNEHDVQWVGEVEWLYKTTFELSHLPGHDTAALEFEGLDTLCDVYLNDTLLFSADNQFRTWRRVFSLDSGLLRGESQNTLILHFKSAKLYAKAEEAKYGQVRAGSTNLGDPSRVYLRKAQYDWRWDWGPELMTCGPYRPITLTTYAAGAKLAEVYPRATLVENHTVPKLSVDVSLDSPASHDGDNLKVKVGISPFNGNVNGDGLSKKTIKEEIYPIGAGDSSGQKVQVAEWKLTEGEVKPWWPTGYGEQNLYEVIVQLIGSDGTILDTSTHRVGFRTVSLVQEPLQEADQYGKGTTFLFEVNGVRIFSGGSNWIPADNFLTTISPDRYRRWLTLLRDGNQNMVRIWGGGIFEPDEFYNICDELGLLVWHDFMFACGIYPGATHPTFIDSVRAEATENVTRLRHHPCIALWCGNNEDYQQVLQWDLKSGGNEEKGIGKDEKDRLLPAWVIYEEVLPQVVQSIQGSDIPYWPGSPYGGKGWDTSDPTTGDVHQWDIWGGKELPWQDYEKKGGRFISEFGIPSFPVMETIKHWMGTSSSESQSFSQSPVMAQHNRAGSHERRFAIVMNDNFRLTDDLETHVYLTQVMQSEAVGSAYRSWRRGWKGRGKEYTSGVLVWQSNDCWPVTSWAIIDYFLRPKPIYYTISRSLSLISVAITRRVHKNRPTDRPIQFYEFGAFQEADSGAEVEVWALNGTLEERKVKLEMWYLDLEDSSWFKGEPAQDILLAPNQCTEVGCWKIPAPPTGKKVVTRVVDGEVKKIEVGRTHSVVAHARLVESGDTVGSSSKVLARFTDWPQPYRYYAPPEPKVKVEVQAQAEGDELTLLVSVKRPVKCLWLSFDYANVAPDGEGKTTLDKRRNDPEGGEEVRWSDNALDVVPGDDQVVKVWGLRHIIAGGMARIKVKGQWLGAEKGVVVAEINI